MDNYIINEFIDLNNQRKQKGKPKRKSIDSKRKARVIEIFEQSNGLIGPDEIADILDLDIEKVREYLGKIRIGKYERLMSEPSGIDSEEGARTKKRKARTSGNTANKSDKLTPSKVRKLTSERNARIMAWHADGLSMEEIARKENLTSDQVKEIFLSLGLSLYTPEQILKMRRQEEEERKSKEEAERLERKRKRKRELARNRRARIKEEKERQEREQEETEQEYVISDYRDVKRKMRELIGQRNSKGAIEFAERYLDDPDFLTKEERSELFMLIEYIKEVRRSYQEQQRSDENAENHEGR